MLIQLKHERLDHSMKRMNLRVCNVSCSFFRYESHATQIPGRGRRGVWRRHEPCGCTRNLHHPWKHKHRDGEFQQEKSASVLIQLDLFRPQRDILSLASQVLSVAT